MRWLAPVGHTTARPTLQARQSAAAAEAAARDRLQAAQSERQRIAAEVEKMAPGVKVEVIITRQYRNMAEGLRKEPRAVAYAQEAFRRLGKEAKLDIVRGGTDGSQLTELGLPTPNLSSGQHNIHSPLEFACLEEMADAARMLVELVQIWAEEK